MSARTRSGRLRRSWPQRLLIVLNTMAVLTALASAGLVAYGKKTISEIQRTPIAGPGFQPVEELEPGDPQNFLIVGVDSDQGLAGNDPVRDGRNGEGLRSDTIMVVRLDPKAGEARILSFPRDLWVDIPDKGRNRINSAIQYGEDGGPSLLINTLKLNFDIDINHYIQVNFAGFKGVIRQIGGLPIYLPNPLRDGYSGLNQPDAGCVTLDADQALAYARSRHLQVQGADGEWRIDGTGDFGRITRQQDFTRRVMRRALDQGATNPATLRRMIENGLATIKLDPYTTAEDLITLGRTFRDFDPDELVTYSLPVVDAFRNGAQVLDLVEDRAEPTLDLFRGTGSAGGTAAEIAPSTVTVRVLNGTGKQNQGARTTNQLAQAKFTVRSPGNDTSERYAQTEVHYREGQGEEALLVARYLDADPALVADELVETVTVITGDDLSAVLSKPRPAEEITTTTSTTTTSTTTSTPDDSAGFTEAPTFGSDASTTTTTTVAESTGPSSEPKGYLPGDTPNGSSCA